jgi:hypothetical protein
VGSAASSLVISQGAVIGILLISNEGNYSLLLLDTVTGAQLFRKDHIVLAGVTFIRGCINHIVFPTGTFKFGCINTQGHIQEREYDFSKLVNEDMQKSCTMRPSPRGTRLILEVQNDDNNYTLYCFRRKNMKLLWTLPSSGRLEIVTNAFVFTQKRQNDQKISICKHSIETGHLIAYIDAPLLAVAILEPISDDLIVTFVHQYFYILDFAANKVSKIYDPNPYFRVCDNLLFRLQPPKQKFAFRTVARWQTRVHDCWAENSLDETLVDFATQGPSKILYIPEPTAPTLLVILSDARDGPTVFRCLEISPKAD